MEGPELRPPLFPGKDHPEVELLVREYLTRASDRWTLVVLDTLEQRGLSRFSELEAAVEGISPKMLTKTLQQMERDGLVVRTVHPEIPPRVEYELTELGRGLGASLCGIWMWISQNLDALHQARTSYWKKRRSTGSQG